jgi:hypothetical protein
MKLKNSKNIVKIYSYQGIFPNHTNIMISKNILLGNDTPYENRLLKISHFNFTKNKKNLESMKFEVFKAIDAETKSILNKASNQVPKVKTKPPQQENKHQIKSESNLKFAKDSEAYKHENTPHSHTSTSQPCKAAKKETKINPNNNIEIHSENPYLYILNKKFNNKSDTSESLKFQIAKTISPFKQEITNTSQSFTAYKNHLDGSIESSNIDYEDSQIREAFAEDENFNEAELEFLEHKDTQRFIAEESEAIQEDSFVVTERDMPLSQLDYLDKDSLSDQEETAKQYKTLIDILNIYTNDPLYKKTFDETKRVNICELRNDVLVSAKSFLVFQNCSILFMLGQLAFQGFSLPWIFIYLLFKYILLQANKGLNHSVIKIMADPATMRFEVYSINLLGIEVCRQYSMFQVARSLECYDFLAYEFHKDELISREFIIGKFCKINNDNFFKNIFLVITRNYDNEFLFKYFHLMYSFTKREMNENLGDSPQHQETFFKSLVKEYFTNFPNYAAYLKEEANKDFKSKNSEHDNRLNVLFVLYLFAFFNFLFDYFVYKYVISVHHYEMEGGIDILYKEERKNNKDNSC